MLYELAANRGAAAELRLLRLRGELLGWFAAEHREIRKIHVQLSVRAQGYRLIGHTVLLAGYLGAIVLVVYLASRAEVSIGDVAMTAADVAERARAGLATQLGPSWPGGVDLSGGQWQKLAIGRAMMRTDPTLLLLDEPTAAIDAETEHELFARWTEAASATRRRSGAITVLVSHRFPTVRMADLILVLRDSGICERGRHAELIAAGGVHAELFELQARAYR